MKKRWFRNWDHLKRLKCERENVCPPLSCVLTLRNWGTVAGTPWGRASLRCGTMSTWPRQRPSCWLGLFTFRDSTLKCLNILLFAYLFQSFMITMPSSSRKRKATRRRPSRPDSEEEATSWGLLLLYLIESVSISGTQKYESRLPTLLLLWEEDLECGLPNCEW